MAQHTEKAYDLTELGERLHGPEGTVLAAHYLDRLLVLQTEVKDRLAGGVPPNDYHNLNRLAEALAAARRVMVLLTSSIAVQPGGRGGSHELDGE